MKQAIFLHHAGVRVRAERIKENELSTLWADPIPITKAFRLLLGKDPRHLRV